MEISERAIKAVGSLVTGDGGKSPYRSGPQLVRFFNQFGANDVYPRGGGFPSRWHYAEQKLRSINGTPEMANAIVAAVDPREFSSTDFDLSEAVKELNHFLQFDEYQVKQQPNGLFDVGKTGEPDWESGSLESFIRELRSRGGELEKTLGENFLAELAVDMEGIHRQERGMAEEFHDLARQQQLADLMVHGIAKALEVKGVALQPSSDEPSSVAFSRRATVVQINTLVTALQENLDVQDHRRNMPPTLDLALDETDDFVDEIRRLSRILVDIRDELQRPEPSQPRATLAKDALREFVLKLSGSFGEGLGKTVTWGTRAAMFWFAVNILKDLGVPVDEFIKAFSGNILPK